MARLALFALICAALPLPALAAPKDPCGPGNADPQQIAQQGLQYYREAGALEDAAERTRHYERALRCYDAALRLAKTPAPLYHPLGLVYEKLGRPVEAVAALERFLREVPEAQRKVGVTSQIDEKLQALYRRVARLDIDTPPGPPVRVDQRPVGVAPLGRLIVVLPGTHSVVVGDPAVGTLGTQVTAAAGEVHRVDLSAWRPRPLPPAATRAVATAPAPPPGRPIYKRWWFWGVLGVAAAGVTTAAVLGTRPWEPRDTGLVFDINP